MDNQFKIGDWAYYSGREDHDDITKDWNVLKNGPEQVLEITQGNIYPDRRYLRLTNGEDGVTYCENFLMRILPEEIENFRKTHGF